MYTAHTEDMCICNTRVQHMDICTYMTKTCRCPNRESLCDLQRPPMRELQAGTLGSGYCEERKEWRDDCTEHIQRICLFATHVTCTGMYAHTDYSVM